MNKLFISENMGFKISWKTITIGLFGDGEIPQVLTCDDVTEYLESLLINIHEQTDAVVTLLCEKDDHDNLKKLLRKLAKADLSNEALQKRKWRACLLKILIDHISNDCLQGLLELMEFWISMGRPDDCPQTFPSSGSKKSVQDYFSQASFKLNLAKNKDWLEREIQSIVKTESTDF